MTAVVQDAGIVHFGLIELDLLATHAGVPVPFPLRVPSFGRITAERDVLLAVAGQTLRMRWLADEAGPIGAAAELVTALREHRGAVDLVLVGPAGSVGITALVYRSSALICWQSLDDDPAGVVRVLRVAETALAEELSSMIPALPGAHAMPIALPGNALAALLTFIGETGDLTDQQQRLRDLVRDNGGDPAVLDQLTGLTANLSGRGQLGATRRVGAGVVRAGTELSWLDGPRGRLRVKRTDDGWVSVNPLRQNGLRAALDELVMIARKN
jgi:hypothetical protein